MRVGWVGNILVQAVPDKRLTSARQVIGDDKVVRDALRNLERLAGVLKQVGHGHRPRIDDIIYGNWINNCTLTKNCKYDDYIQKAKHRRQERVSCIMVDDGNQRVRRITN